MPEDPNLIPKCTKYIRRVLGLIPSVYESYDATHAAIVYFCVLSLKLMNALTPRDQEEFTKYTDSLFVGCGYKMSQTYLSNESNAHLPATFFCLAIRKMVKSSELSNTNKKQILNFVNKCRSKNHLFRICLSENSETSLRHTYTALAIYELLGTEIPQKNDIANAIVNLQTYEGGFTDLFSLNEAHSGFTYCALGSLKFCDSLHLLNSKIFVNLSNRQLQNGGVNGRPNKPADVCYAYWVVASQRILGVEFTNLNCRDYILNEGYDYLLGGFVKQEGETADPYHTALGLAALSLMDYKGLGGIDPVLTIAL